MWLWFQTIPNTRIWLFLKTTMHFLCIASHCSSLSYSSFSTQTSQVCGCIYALCLHLHFCASLLNLSSSLVSRQPRTHSARLVALWPYHHQSTLQHGCVTKWSSLMERNSLLLGTVTFVDCSTECFGQKHSYKILSHTCSSRQPSVHLCSLVGLYHGTKATNRSVSTMVMLLDDICQRWVGLKVS